VPLNSLVNEISYNEATKRATIVALLHSFVKIQDTEFYRNQAELDTAVLYLSGGKERYTADQATSEINYSTLTKNLVNEGGALLTAIESNLKVDNCYFTANFITMDTEGISATFSNIWVYNTRFYYLLRGFLINYYDDDEWGEVTGTYLKIGQNCSTYVYNSTFEGGRAKLGGAVYLEGRSTLWISASQFKRNIAFAGGAIYATSFSSLSIVNGTTFLQNVAYIGQGVNLYAEGAF